MMSKMEQTVISSGAMLRSGRGQMCSRVEYRLSLNAMTQVLHTTFASGEKGAFDKKSFHECDV
jgi:hypothetical protein